MTKAARVILIIFLISSSFVFAFPVSAGFGELLKPIPEDNIQHLTFNNETIEQSDNTAPSVTFGDLLNEMSNPSAENPPVSTDEKLLAEKTARFKELLAQLEESYQISLAEFRAKQETLPRNIPYVLDHPSPTPFIPVAALVAGVSELATNNPASILGASSQPTTNYPTPTLTDQLLLASIPTAVPSPNLTNLSNLVNAGNLTQNPPKTYYTIALLGDSMTDTLGRDLPHLKNLLKNAYPDYTFSLLNYGYGATDLESGLYRLTNGTNYLGTNYPPLLSFKVDILVVESFAYNHWSGEKYDLDRQWITIAKIADTVREKSADTKIILAATIAPNKYSFGDGVLNWSAAAKENASLVIKAYLQNLVNFATSQAYPLADAYHPTLDSAGNGIGRYINSYDHLHPSGEGAYLFSQKILEAIKNNALIN